MRKFVLSFWMATIAARVHSAPMPNYIKEVKIFNKIKEVEEEQITTDGSLCVTVKFGDEKRVNDNDDFDFIYETQLLGTPNSPSSELVFGTKTFNMGSYDVVAPVNMIFLHTCNEEDLKGDDNEAKNTPYFLTLSSEDSVLHEYKPGGTVGIIGQASFNIVDVAEEEEQQQAGLDLIEESTESENNDVRIVQHEYKIVPAHDSEKHHGHKNIKPRPNPLRLKDGD